MNNYNNALFSFIVPIYNAEHYLQQCIDSITNQTFGRIEIVLVDDGSVDKSGNICDNVANRDSRVIVVHKPNGGIVSARQAGINNAHGDYIICVDADDWVELDYCEKMHKVIRDYNPDIICCGYYEAYPDRYEERALLNRKGYYSKDDIEAELFQGLLQDPYGASFNLSLWAKATKRELFEAHQLYDVVVNVGEDIAGMAPCFFHAESIYLMEDLLYYYRNNPTSMTKGKKVFRWDGPLIRGNHLQRHLDLSKGDFQQQLYRSIVHSVFTVVTSQYNRENEKVYIINNDIRRYLKEPLIEEAINHAVFKGLKGNLMKYSLKYRLLWVIRIINKVR